jgi:enamine deaminase RidA (YjgF/YER057c/UK114 family)
VDISYLGITESVNDLPIISQTVVYGDSVYTCGVIADPTGDIAQQTQQVLDRIDRLLRVAGTDKSRLLTAQVWLRDMHLFAAHNVVWNAWVDPAHPPVRVCVAAELVHPDLLVEIMVTAAHRLAVVSS